MEKVVLSIKGEFFSEIKITIPEKNYIKLDQKINIDSLPILNVDLLKSKLNNPIHSNTLKHIAKSKKKCVILVDDPSRPTPTQILVPLIIKELNDAGLKDKNIRLFIAKGTHKTFSQDQIREKLGDIVDRCEVLQNESNIDSDYEKVKNLKSGKELYVHKKVMECDLKIGVGQIILSPFAGFTGGPKIVLPGACSEKTIFQNHIMAFDKYARVGEVHKNPVRIDMNEAADAIGLDFLYNVTLDYKKHVIFAECGDPISVFELGVKTMMDDFSIKIDNYLDMIIYNTYPSDRSLYYTISKSDIGELAVGKDGTVVVIGSCSEGIGDESFYKLLSKDPEEIMGLATAGMLRADWAGVSYRLVKILKEKKIVMFVPPHIKNMVSICNNNLYFCENLNDLIQSFIKKNPTARIGYISSQFTLPKIVEDKIRGNIC